jgi:hypothetical protein
MRAGCAALETGGRTTRLRDRALADPQPFLKERATPYFAGDDTFKCVWQRAKHIAALCNDTAQDSPISRPVQPESISTRNTPFSKWCDAAFTTPETFSKPYK